MATPLGLGLPPNLQQALASLVHPNSFAWFDLAQVEGPVDKDLDVVTTCQLCTPTAALAIAGCPDLPDLCCALEGGLGSPHLDPAFTSALASMLAKVGHLDPPSLLPVPLKALLLLTAEAIQLCAVVRERQQQFHALEEATGGLTASTIPALPYPAADQEEGVVGAHSDTEALMADGWEGDWWGQRSRVEADAALVEKVQSWSECERRDDAVESDLRLMHSQFHNLLRRIAILRDLVPTHLLTALPPWVAAHQCHLQHRWKALVAEQSGLALDLQRVSQRSAAAEARLAADLQNFGTAMVPNNELIASLEQQIQELERLLQCRHDEYLTAKTALLHEEQHATANVHANRLREEAREIARNIEFEMAELKAKEFQAIQSDIRFDQAHREQVTQAKDRARMELAALDLKLEDDKRTIKQQLHDLKAQLDSVEQARSQQDRQQVEACKAASAFLSQLEAHAELLTQCTARVEAGKELVEWAQATLTSLALAMVAFGERSREASPSQASLSVDALECGGWLTTALRSAMQDRQARIASVDKTLTRHIQLLEFCVDTHDPNAHKHQSIISGLQGLRAQLAEDVARFDLLHIEVASVSRDLLHYVTHHFTELHSSSMARFQRLPCTSQEGSPPTSPLAMSPSSRLVHCKGTPLPSPCSCRAPLAAPFGPVPGSVARARWESLTLPPDAGSEPSIGSSVAGSKTQPSISRRTSVARAAKASRALPAAPWALSDTLAAELLGDDDAATTLPPPPSDSLPTSLSVPASRRRPCTAPPRPNPIPLDPTPRVARRLLPSSLLIRAAAPLAFDHQQFLKKGLS